MAKKTKPSLVPDDAVLGRAEDFVLMVDGVPVVRNLEPFLNARELRAVLKPIFPGITGQTIFEKLIPFLPHAILPGGKRKLYQVSRVVEVLEGMISRVQPEPRSMPIDTPLHRRRSSPSRQGRTA